ncbi:porin [Vibrio profundum]|uniref:porin n=1 Tax=Vibrio profundum TaxID=2910247 RepID=UPI003D0C01A3
MKRTLIALAVLAAAGSANAAQIYGSDTSKVSMKGEIDSYLSTFKQDTSATADTKRSPDVDMWAKIQIDAEHQLNDKFTAFGSFEIESSSGYDLTADSDFDAVFDDLYAGVKTDTWGVAIGEHGDWGDSMDATEKDDITNEGYYLGNAGGHHTESSGHGISYKYYGIDGLTYIADITTDQTDGVDPTYGTSLDYTMGNYSVGASFQAGDQATGITGVTGTYAATDYYKGGISASATFGGFYAAATYVAYEGVNGFGFFDAATAGTAPTVTGADFYEGNSYGLAASYTIDKVRLYSTYAVMSNDKVTAVTSTTSATTDVNDADVSNWVLGTDYTISDNLLVFAEYQTSTAESGFTKTVDYDAYSVILGSYYTF